MPLPRRLRDPLAAALRASALIGALLIASWLAPFCAAVAADPAPARIAVFDFELEDASASGANDKSDPAADAKLMEGVTDAARSALRQSGRYVLVDTAGAQGTPVKQKTLHSCNGCEAAIALQLGADQSLIGLITRVAKTEYYASLRITDARTGKVLNDQSAFFTGSDEAWQSGVRMLIKHGILSTPD